MNEGSSTMSKMLDTREAAEYIGMSESWLRQSRMNGHLEGRTPPPPFIRIGRAIRYSPTDLDNWLQSNRVELIAPASD